jgi:hypothetical protein
MCYSNKRTLRRQNAYVHRTGYEEAHTSASDTVCLYNWRLYIRTVVIDFTPLLHSDSMNCQVVKTFEVVDEQYSKQESRCGESQTNHSVSDRMYLV